MAWNIHTGDCLEVLRGMADQSVHCCVTSPPYWGLRLYLPDGVKLRDDLSDEERAFIVTELGRLGVSPVDLRL